MVYPIARQGGLQVELKHEFEIGRPVADVWERLLDLRNVAGALPGASIDDVESDGTHHGSLRLKLGAFVASFRGTARYTQVDDQDHRVVLVARGSSTQGQANVELVGRASPGLSPGSTRVELVSKVVLSGRIANFGASLASDVARQVLDQFVANLTAAFEADAGSGAPAPTGAPSATEPRRTTAPSTDALDLGAVLLPPWLSRPVPLPVALGMVLVGVLLGRAMRRPARGFTVALPPLARESTL
jgi:carbon monoxide dehydrogenase subunit G